MLKLRIEDLPNGKQSARMFFYNNETSEKKILSTKYQIFYRPNEIHLKEGEYTLDIFSSVPVVAFLIGFSEKSPVCTSRIFEVKREHKKYFTSRKVAI